MQYVCYKCGIEISNDIRKRFIAESGICLCEKCSVGVSPCSDSIRAILYEFDKK